MQNPAGQRKKNDKSNTNNQQVHTDPPDRTARVKVRNLQINIPGTPTASCPHSSGANLDNAFYEGFRALSPAQYTSAPGHSDDLVGYRFSKYRLAVSLWPHVPGTSSWKEFFAERRAAASQLADVDERPDPPATSGRILVSQR